MKQAKGFKPRGLCICKLGVPIKQNGNLTRHYPSKPKFTNRDGYCTGTDQPPVLILVAKRQSIRENDRRQWLQRSMVVNG